MQNLKNCTCFEMDIQENQNFLCRRRQTGKNVEIESALKLWLTNVQKDDAQVNGPLMHKKLKIKPSR